MERAMSKVAEGWTKTAFITYTSFYNGKKFQFRVKQSTMPGKKQS